VKKKGKLTVTITMGIACFALVMVMFMQFKIVSETDITSIETMREEELRTELANWKDKYQEANNQYEEKNQKLQEYKDKEASNAESSELIQKELDQVNVVLGKTDVEGEGITITLKDSDDVEVGKITSDNLLSIVNALKLAGAEAISINEERIINMSDIVTVNLTVIKVNQQRILSPYIIKAIGNQTYLESSLLGNGGYIDQLKKIGHDVSIEKSTKNNKIKIPKYNKEITTKYMK
jgi:uncharacterized protein YlxW (UPF0749 family)